MVKIKYNQEIRWGAEELATAAASLSRGEVVGGSRKKGAKTTEIEGRDGSLFSLVIYNRTEEFDLEVIAEPGATLPEIGDVAVIGGVKFVIMSADETWKNNDAVKFKVSCKAWLDAGNPEAGGVA